MNKAKEDISIQVASAYLQVLFNEELAQVAHLQVELSKEMLAQKEAYFKTGKASEAEWLEAKSRVAQDQLSAVQADNNYKLALLDLSQLLELPSPDNFSLVSPQADMEEYMGSITIDSDILEKIKAVFQKKKTEEEAPESTEDAGE